MIAFSDPNQAPSGFAFADTNTDPRRNAEAQPEVETQAQTQADTGIPSPTAIRVHVDGNYGTDGNRDTDENRNTEDLGHEIARLSAHLNAATYRLLVLIREFDSREGWGNGFLSCAHWLSWRTGISARPAREKVRVARALAPLRRISEAMACGTLSYSKVRALTRVATPENEEDLLDVARHATAAQLEKLVRAWRRVEDLRDPGKEEQRHQRRFLRLHQDDDGSYLIQGRLDPEVGAVLEKALEWANEALYQEDSATAFQHRMADGLGLVAERALAAETPTSDPRPVSRAERFQVVVHVGADELRTPLASGTEDGSAEPRGLQGGSLKPTKPERGSGEPQDLNVVSSETAPSAGGSGEPRFSNGGNSKAPTAAGGSAEPRESEPQHSEPPASRSGPHMAAVSGSPGTLEFLPPETSRRLSCDAGLVVMSHDSTGGVLDVGRKTRTVPAPMRRALDARDKGCRFPGCECRYTEAHHIQHWAQGGETKLDNLLLLCFRHHRALHEGGFQVRRVAGEGEVRMGGAATGDDVQFFSPAGKVIPAVPEDPPLWRDLANPGDPMGRGDPMGQGDPVREIVARNAEAGIVPDAWTATPLWNGDPLDLSLAVDMFLGIGER